MDNAASSHAVGNEEPRISRFEFKGTGKEYFGIWIVNILLTIVTLGIFSAWAKVRNKQYFYGNTYLEGSSFEYTALPMQILKGRIIAVVFFVAYNLASNYLPTLGIVLGLILFILAPWVIMKSLAFNARYSQYRNIRFGFHQDLKESAKVFVLIPLLAFLPIVILIGIFSFGAAGQLEPGSQSSNLTWYFAAFTPVLAILFYIAYPYVVYRTKRYVADNHRYGNADFDLRLDSAKPFYKLYLKAGLILIVALICVGIVVASLGFFHKVGKNPEILGPQTQPSFIETVKANDTDTESLNPESLNPESLDFENLDLENLDLEKLGLEDLDLSNFDLKNVDLENSESQDQQAPIPEGARVLIFIVQLLSALVYLYIFAYIAAHTYNLIYQNTKVGDHRLRAKMKPRELAMIYFTNTLGIILTLGLFIPWAMVRTARYRVDNTALQVNGDLNNFVATQDEHQNVFGEEFGDVFDLDVGI